MSVRELFRRKLESAEVIPDPSVNAKLMRKLARREFIRFNPASFNAYYLGGITCSSYYCRYNSVSLIITIMTQY